MNKWLELLVGVVLLAIPIWLWAQDTWGLGVAAIAFLKGGLVWFVLLIGALFIMLGISDLKN